MTDLGVAKWGDSLWTTLHRPMHHRAIMPYIKIVWGRIVARAGERFVQKRGGEFTYGRPHSRARLVVGVVPDEVGPSTRDTAYATG